MPDTKPPRGNVTTHPKGQASVGEIHGGSFSFWTAAEATAFAALVTEFTNKPDLLHDAARRLRCVRGPGVAF